MVQKPRSCAVVGHRASEPSQHWEKNLWSLSFLFFIFISLSEEFSALFNGFFTVNVFLRYKLSSMR